MVSHGRTAAQRREQRRGAEARFAGRLCKLVELWHRGSAPSHALLRVVADYMARAERLRADAGTPIEDDVVHTVVPQERNFERTMEQTLDAPVPQVNETSSDRVCGARTRLHQKETPGQARRSRTCRCRCSAFPWDRVRASGTCGHLRSSSDRFCGVRACRHRHGACSNVCIRG